MIQGTAGLCSTCFSALSFLTDPLCASCGRPHPRLEEESTLCGACLTQPPAYDALRAAFAYDDPSRDLILGLKYKDRLDLVPVLGQWMANAAKGLLAETDVLMPVPLHWQRHLARRFNQSAALAQDLASRTGRPYAPDWIRRVRNTPQMRAMNRVERQKNVAGAFAIQEDRRQALKGKRVVLVDDVYTSGATIEALCHELRDVGVSHIGVVVIARVVSHTHIHQEFELE